MGETRAPASDLLIRCQRGDRQALGELFSQIGNDVLRTAYLLTGDRNVAFAVLKWPHVVSTITGRMPPGPHQIVAVKRVVEFPVDPDLQSSLAQVLETPQRMPQTRYLSK